MNNLKYFRTLTDLEPKELSALLGVSVYTYRAYETDRMIMDEIIIKLICKLFNVEKEELFIEKDKLRQETINKLIYYTKFNKKEKIKLLVFNLSGKYCEKISFAELSKIRSNLW